MASTNPRWIVEREMFIGDEATYDETKQFDNYTDANDYFEAIDPLPGERWWLEYSSDYDAQMLAVKCNTTIL